MMDQVMDPLVSVNALEKIVLGNGDFWLIPLKAGSPVRIGYTVQEAKDRLKEMGKEEQFPYLMQK
ncbi:MAG: hypothetical protein E6713_13880 [Sporomusaceae bacterium]|nr:hypothetical protein [Sporomusaceae bacterium]